MHNSISIWVGAMALAMAAVACNGDDDSSGETGTGGDAGAATGTGGSNTGGGNTGGGNTGGGNTGGGNTGGGSSSGAFNSSLPDDLVLGEATAAQSDQFCEDANAFMGESQSEIDDFMCRSTGLMSAMLLMMGGAIPTDSELQGACSEAYDACVADPGTSAGDCTPPDATCTATVAEAEACLNDSMTQLDDLSEQLPSCDELSVASVAELATIEQPAEPASCTTYDQKCPDGAMGAGG